jgi:dGTPase
VAPNLEFRERTEELERASLSSWATLAVETKGRDRHEDPDPFRTVFQNDRDRILGSAEWRGLAYKTAVLPLHPGRTRLQEAVEVAQVARTLARALRLNEDLAEAVSLGQALGATPFAEAGEEALQTVTERVYRCEEQALRVVERLAGQGAGLNLTWETRDGILHRDWDGKPASTLEGEVARFARRIVGVSLDAQDALREGLLPVGRSEPGPLTELGEAHPERIDRMITDVARESLDRPTLGMSTQVAELTEHLSQAAREALAARPRALADRARAVHCVASVAVFLLEGGAPAGQTAHHPGPIEVIDEVAAATDAELIATYRSMFEPEGLG